MDRSMKGHGRTGHIMVMELTFLEKGNGKETSILENSRMEKRMDKEHTLFLMVDKYVGEFKNGKQHGQGIFTTPSGNKYVGEFKDGKQHGKGKLTSRFEKEYIGEFKEGILWNITEYDKNGNILTKTINGEKQQ